MVNGSAPSSLGPLLRQWRERRRMSQLALALEAEISSRHLSFMETGRSRPSREMVLLLAEVLDVPPRARNDLLAAAGYAPIYRESDLDAPEMAQFHRALDFILRQQEPYPAIVLDRYWNVLLANEGTDRFMDYFWIRKLPPRWVPRTPCDSSAILRLCGPTSSIGKRQRPLSSSGSTAIFSGVPMPGFGFSWKNYWPTRTYPATGERSIWMRQPHRS